IANILKVNETEYWIADKSFGLFSLSILKNGAVLHKQPVYLKNRKPFRVQELYKDNEEGVWIGLDSSVAYTHSVIQHFFTILVPKMVSDKEKNINSIYTDDHVHFIIGTNKGIYLYNDSNATEANLNFPGNHKAGEVHCFYNISSTELLCGTSVGL